MGIIDMDLDLETFDTGTGQTILVHSKEVCEGRYCCIHNPSDHHMKDWPIHWRSDRRIMERICPHGVGHPDPDDAAYRHTMGDDDNMHGCDGCCVPPKIVTNTDNGLVYYKEHGSNKWKLAGRENHPLTERFIKLLKGEIDENSCVCGKSSEC